MQRIRFTQDAGGFHAGDEMEMDDFAADALVRCGAAEYIVSTIVDQPTPGPEGD